MATAPESNLALHSSSSSNYDVFLSFRGPDTRKNFTDHLYTALIHNGIRTFRDEEELEIGEPIMPNLLKFIQESRISIPIISPDYASSRSCLEELAKIMECKQMIGQIVMPIFFHVDVGDVKNQTGSFAQAFCSHEELFHMDKVMEWRKALREVGQLKGYDSKNVENGSEAKLVQLVLTEVLSELDNTTHNMHVAKYQIGIESRVEDMSRLLDVGSQDVRFVGVHGMGGLGKTTIAKAVFNKIHRCFDGSAFIRVDREKGSREEYLVYLQNKLICDILNLETNPIRDVDIGKSTIKRRMSAKKILVILDDVDTREQLEALVGEPNWFGSGSRIIITTRDMHVLNVLGVDNLYKPKELGHNQSLQLLSWHAFRSSQPPNDFVDLSKKVALATGGLPLALEVLGSLLVDKSLDEWADILKKLQRVPPKEILEKLKISYDALEDECKDMFLDIACLLIGTDKEIAIKIWEGCDFYPKVGIKVLVQRSLINIYGNTFMMHDLLRDMGRAIVNQQKDPGERSRLWRHEDVLDVLRNRKGTKNIEGLTVSVKGDVFTTKAFANMSNLRLLRVEGARLVGNFEDLPPQLRWLCLRGCFLDFKLNRFHLEKLVVLDLSETNIVRIDWHRNKKVAANLKVISLRGCRYLEELPTSICNLTSLESLNLENCNKLNELPSRLGGMESLTKLLFCESSIEQLPDSIGLLKNLKTLNLFGCRSLTRLPDSLGELESLRKLLLCYSSIREIPVSVGSLKKLETLDASFCELLTMLPNSIGGLESLLYLQLDGTPILELPESIGGLESLLKLELDGTRILELPESIWTLVKLEELGLGRSLGKLPNSLGRMESLAELSLSGRLLGRLPDWSGNLRNLNRLFICEAIITELPDAFGSLEKLEVLCLWDCKKLVKLPDSMGKLKRLITFEVDESSIVELPKDFGMLSSLKELSINNCQEFKCFPDTFGSLTQLGYLELKNNSKLTVLPPSLSRLCSLEELKASGCNLSGAGAIPDAFGELSSLKRLDLGYNNFHSLPTSISGISLLEKLSLQNCTELASLPELPTSLIELDLTNCISMERLPDLSNLKRLRELRLVNCDKLPKIQGLKRLESLEILNMCGCSNLHSLNRLNTGHCNLSGAGAITDDFGELSSLETLHLDYNNFRSLPTSISGISLLQDLSLQNCTEPASLPELPTSLIKLDLTNCVSMERLPDLSNLKRLRELRLANCDKLPEIQGLERLESLEILNMAGCTAFANTLKKSLSQGVFEGLHQFIFPGSEIPKWFTHQNLLSSKFPRVRNSGDEIEGWILCFVFAIDENTEKDLHQPYATTFILHVELQIWRNHKKLYSAQLQRRGIPKVHQDHIYLEYFQEGSVLQHSKEDYGQFTKELKYGDQIQISIIRYPWEPPGFHVKKAGLHVVYKPKVGFDNDEIESAIEEDGHQSVSIAEKLSEFFTSSARSCGVNEGESTSVKEANERGRNDDNEDEEIVRGKSKWDVPFHSELHQQPLHEFVDGGDNSRAICSEERIAGEGAAKPFIDVNLKCCDELVDDGSNRRAMDSRERRAGEGAAEPFTDLGLRLFCCFLIAVFLPVTMAWSIGMGFY